jgi:IS605 OrfB family transposase
MFLVGERGRDADFRADGMRSIWTVAGRKRITYTVPPALRPLFDTAQEIDSAPVSERQGKLYGRVALTLEAPAPQGVTPVGIDLNETNAVMAVDADGRAFFQFFQFFQTGKATKVRNQRTMQTSQRVQRKLAAKKAEGADTHGVRRARKRLSGRRRRRTQDFARVVAKQLSEWAPADAILVFEDLQMPQPYRELRRGVALRRRLSQWQHGAIRVAVTNKAPLVGLAIVSVNPAYTSQKCSRCGRRGKRHPHASPARGVGRRSTRLSPPPSTSAIAMSSFGWTGRCHPPLTPCLTVRASYRLQAVVVDRYLTQRTIGMAPTCAPPVNHARAGHPRQALHVLTACATMSARKGPSGTRSAIAPSCVCGCSVKRRTCE